MDRRVLARRAGSMATPARSPGVPTSWYDDLSDVAIDDSGAIYVVGATAPAGTTARTELPPSRPEDVVIR